MTNPTKRCGKRKNVEFPFTVKEMKDKLIQNIDRLKYPRSKTDIRRTPRPILCKYFSTKNKNVLKFNLTLIKKRRVSPPASREKSKTPERARSKSKTPPRMERSKSPRRSASKSPHRRSKSKSPVRSVSKSPRRSKSKSPLKNKSKSPVRSVSKSPLRRSKSKSPLKSKSKSPARSISKSPSKNRSKSPRRSKSKSPPRMERSKSKSPRRSASKSPLKKSKSPRRSKSPLKGKSRSKSPKRSKSPERSRSNSPVVRDKQGEVLYKLKGDLPIDDDGSIMFWTNGNNPIHINRIRRILQTDNLVGYDEIIDERNPVPFDVEYVPYDSTKRIRLRADYFEFTSYAKGITLREALSSIEARKEAIERELKETIEKIGFKKVPKTPLRVLSMKKSQKIWIVRIYFEGIQQ